MPFVEINELPHCFEIRKKLGKESLVSEYPEYGIYQQRYRRKDFWQKGYTPKGKRRNFKMKFYRPTNPRTEKQQAHRQILAEAVALWKALPLSTKKEYNKKAYGKQMSGYNKFISEYLNQNKIKI